MSKFDENYLLAQSQFENILGKYKERNPISRYLVNNFYACIEKFVQELDPDDRILEAGCGAGLSSLRIKSMLSGQKMEISDVDEAIIDMFRDVHFPIPFRHESVLNLDRKDGEFDCVILLEVLEHIPDYEKALKELFRVSKKYVIISTPNEPIWRILNLARGKYIRGWGNTPEHVNHWSTGKLVKLISKYGRVIKVYTPLPWNIVLARTPDYQGSY